MSISRRDFLKVLGVLAAGAGAASSCAPLASYLPHGKPYPLDPAVLTDRSWLALSRICYGPRGEDLYHLAEIGLEGYLEEQLSPGLLTDTRTDLLLSRFDVLKMDPDALRNRADKIFDHYDPDVVLTPFRQATILRKVYSRRQLFEIMVEFWSDHFNISVQKGDCWFLKIVDDREVIRAHALGNFRELLGASAHSPAMLVYLDNQENHRDAPNENYSRELLELHTLGVEGGYSQQDVMALARCLTGWRVKDHFWRGELHFKEDAHSPGTKQVLDRIIQASGKGEIDQVLDLLATHPATADHIAHKLTRKFLGDPPPTEIVSRASQAFHASGGDLLPTLRVILLDGLAQTRSANLPLKYKRPLNYLVSALRQTGSDTDGGSALQEYLKQMGQPLYDWPTPDGYPDNTAAWQGNLLPRWRFALELVQDQVPGTVFDHSGFLHPFSPDSPDSFIRCAAAGLLGGELPPPIESQLLISLQPTLEAEPGQAAELAVAALLASPAFQWH